ncbi:MAG TPA: ABC transporter permease [Terracidiphilus sp.]|jgi:putative ABC transport system permease protein|nr:ABC transporter permease [Terracidiphilus sp.]
MRWFHQLAIRLRMLFHRGAAGAELDSEVQYHLDRQIAENVAAGMPPEQARTAALRTFGNPALLRDQARATWSWSSVESLLRDLRYSARTLRRTPGFTIIAILVMALGIGANVALFTVVRGVLLRPLPFKDPNRLLMLYETGLNENDPPSYNVVAPGIFAEWKNHNHSFESLALEQDGDFSLAGSGGQLPEKLHGSECSWDLFNTLGVHPALGRDFTAADDTPAANGTVILSWSLFKRRFDANPAILNQTIRLDARTYTVIGVMPSWFAFPDATTQLWTPVYHYTPAKMMIPYDFHMFWVIGRLKPGVMETQARADLSVISRQIHNAHPENPFIDRRANSRPLLEHLVGDIQRPLYVLLAATGCVLLIACLNVANLLVARAAARRKELAIRTALGGGWLRLLRERLMESLLLSGAGGALGLLLAMAALQWLLRERHDMARVNSIHLDLVVAGFTVAVIAVCALFAGLISALGVGGKNVLSVLHESSRAHSGGASRTRLRRTLLVLEVGLTVVLLTGAGLLLKSYERMRSADMGCNIDNVLTMNITLPGARYKTPGPAPAEFFNTLLEYVRALPGVEAAGLVTAVPGQGYGGDFGFTVVEHPALPPGAGIIALNRAADPGYFAAMGIPMLRGRTFNPALRLDKANEIVISNLFARKYLPGEELIGKHIKIGFTGKTYTIVGVVGDTRFAIGEPPREMMYFAYNDGNENYGTLILRSSHDVERLAIPVQQVIQGMDRDVPVSDILTMQQLLGRSMLDQSFNTTLLVGFGAMSLLLAAVGLFGVLSYMVAQRTAEIGIRMALGAPRSGVLSRVLLDGLRPAAIGLVLGLAASAEASRVLRDMLYETRPLDPWVFAAVAITLMLVACAACILPAWRASRVDPMQALRTE